MDSLNEQFQTRTAREAQKALDYLDGCQLEHVIELLDNPNHGRRQWKERGIRPQYRNFTSMVIQKSGMLWDSNPPVLEVWNGDNMDEGASQTLNDQLDAIQFVEFMQNFDEVVRLQKTAIILQQYDELNGRMILDILHRGNCLVEADPFTKQIHKLTYKIEEIDDEYTYYRIYTPEIIQDWREGNKPGNRPEMISEIENPYGFVPASQFHDTNIPRVGFWNKAPQDLIRFNDMYNLHLVDVEFAASWEIHKTLFTNTDLEGGAGAGQVQTAQVHGSLLPRQVASGTGIPGGLGSIVTVDSTGIEQPFVEYKGPDSDLLKLQTVYQQWSKDFAGDWGVNLKFAGEGTANSGFQLVVESMDNLDLRKKRQRFAENGLARFYQVFKRVMNTHFKTFPEDSIVEAKFSAPQLPVNQREQEEVWSLRIEQGRATPIDYYMDVHGMTKEEALEKWEEIKQFNLDNELQAVPGFVEEL